LNFLSAPLKHPDVGPIPPASAAAPANQAAEAAQQALGAAKQACQLMDEVEQAIDRLRFRGRWDNDYGDCP
jgi:hypothetical protein